MSVNSEAFRLAQHLPLDRIRALCVGALWLDVNEGTLKAERDHDDDLTGWLSFDQYDPWGRVYVRADCVQGYRTGPLIASEASR